MAFLVNTPPMPVSRINYAEFLLTSVVCVVERCIFSWPEDRESGLKLPGASEVSDLGTRVVCTGIHDCVCMLCLLGVVVVVVSCLERPETGYPSGGKTPGGS